MTKKRFTYEIDESNGHLVDVWYDNGKPIYSTKNVCDLLNALHEENEQLKQTIETQDFNYKNAKGIIHSSEHQIQRLQDENERLKSEINMLKITIGRNEGYIDRLTHTGEWR